MSRPAANPAAPLRVRLHSLHLSGLVSLAPSETLHLVVRPPGPLPAVRSPPPAKVDPVSRRITWPPSFEPSFDARPPSAAARAAGAGAAPACGPPRDAGEGASADHDADACVHGAAATHMSTFHPSANAAGPMYDAPNNNRRRRRVLGALRALSLSTKPVPTPASLPASASASASAPASASRTPKQPPSLQTTPPSADLLQIELVVSSQRRTSSPPDSLLGRISLPLHTLATGPRHHSLVLVPAYGRPSRFTSPLCLSFDAVAVEQRQISLGLTDVSLSITGSNNSNNHSNTDTRAAEGATHPYLVLAFIPAADDVLAHAQTRSSRPRASAAHIPAASPDGRRDSGSTTSPSSSGRQKARQEVVVVSTPSTAIARNNCTWDSLQPIVLPSCSLAALAHGQLCIRLHDASHGANVLLAKQTIPFHHIFYTNRFTVDLTSLRAIDGPVTTPGRTLVTAAVSASIRVTGAPQTAQMLGGVHTDFGIFGARPVIFGVPIPHTGKPVSSGVLVESSSFVSDSSTRSSSCGSSEHLPNPAGDVRESLSSSTENPTLADNSHGPLPRGWHELVDSFSYKYWHNSNCSETRAATHTRAPAAPTDSWLRPDSFGVVQDDEDDLASEFDVERVGPNCFRTRATGVEFWIHPRAVRVSGLPRTPTAPATVPGPVVSRANVAALPLAMQNKAELEKKENSETPELQRGAVAESHGQLHETPKLRRSVGPRPLADEKGLTSDVRWSVSNESMLSCPGTEGHTLTKHGDRCVIKFGGAMDNGRKLNSVFSLDPVTMHWSERPAVGALPEGRVGHGAIPLNTQKMLVFGGTSRLGRLNDMHVFDEWLNAWSPVACSGTRPAPRARLGMAAWGDSALLFGGREGYMYMADRYFSDVHCFNATRTEWLPVNTRGVGPTPRCGMAVEVLNERLLFVHGGFDEKKYFSETWLLDTVSCTWQRPPYRDPLLEPCGRESHASTTFGNSVLVYGGEADGMWCSDLFVFDSERLRWVGAPEASGYTPGGRSGPALAALDDRRVVLVGGSTGFHSTNDTHVLDTQFLSLRDLDKMKERGIARGPDADSCVVCLDGNPSVMFAFCGHTVLCSTCSKRAINHCPVCRQLVGKMVNLEAH